MKVQNTTGQAVHLSTITTLDGIEQPLVLVDGVIDVDKATGDRLVEQGWKAKPAKTATKAAKSVKKTAARKSRSATPPAETTAAQTPPDPASAEKEQS